MINTVFEDDFRLKVIYQVLIDYRKLGYNELERIIVKEKQVMSQRTFRERLHKLVEMQLVIRDPDEISNRVWYSVHKDSIETEKQVVKNTKLKVNELQKMLRMLGHDYKKLPTIEKAISMIIFFRLLYAVEYNLYYYFLSQYYKNSQLRKLKQQLDEIRHQLFHLSMTGKKEERDNVHELMSKSFFRLEGKEWEELNHFLHNPNRFNEIKY